jgi:hypothetical protein
VLWAAVQWQPTDVELCSSAALQNRRNATCLCRHVVSDECIQRTTPEICITLLMEELQRGPAATAASGSSSNCTAAIAAPVAVGGALLVDCSVQAEQRVIGAASVVYKCGFELYWLCWTRTEPRSGLLHLFIGRHGAHLMLLYVWPTYMQQLVVVLHCMAVQHRYILYVCR